MRSRRVLLLGLLALALAVRLIRLDSPILGMHSWRQADTAAMARNFHENGYRFTSPQIDWGGDSGGEVESEFPLYSFAAALLYRVFGTHEALGRLLSVLCSLVAILFLIRLVARFSDEKTALWAGGFYAFLPLNVFYSRAYMPESAMLMFSILGLYWFDLWRSGRAWTHFLLSALCVCLACLLKLPALYLGLPLLYLSGLTFGRRLLRQPSLWLYALLVLAPVVWWYRLAQETFLRTGLTFGIWGYGTDKWGNWSLLTSGRFWDKLLFRSLAERHFTWIGFPLFLLGLFLPRADRRERFFDVFLLAILVYVLVVARGNYVHEYYQLPLMIPASVVLGRVAARFLRWPPWRNPRSLLLCAALLGTVALGAFRFVTYLGYESPQASPQFRLAQAMRNLTPTDSLAIAVDKGDPTLLYLSHRKGWHAAPGALDEPFLTERANRGAAYLFGLYKDFRDPREKAELAALLGRRRVLLDDGTGFIAQAKAQERRP